MRRTTLLGLAALAMMAAPALADVAGGPIYWNDANQLFQYNVPSNSSTLVGTFKWYNNPAKPASSVTVSNMRDIAFSGSTWLYGVAQYDAGAGVDAGSFWKIDPATAQVWYVGSTFVDPAGNPSDIGTTVNALASYGTGKFYAAVDGGTMGSPDAGHFYDLWLGAGGTLYGRDVGLYHDDDDESAFGNNYKIVSTGDLWVGEGGTVYATVEALDSIQIGEAKYMLVTVDPATAEVDFVTALPYKDPWDSRYLDSIAGYGSGGDLYLIQGSGTASKNGRIWIWDGSTLTLSSLDVGCTQAVEGATAIPAPGAIVLGLIGLGVAGWIARRMA